MMKKRQRAAASAAHVDGGLVLLPVAQVVQQRLLDVQLYVKLRLKVDVRGVTVTLGPARNVDDLSLVSSTSAP